MTNTAEQAILKLEQEIGRRFCVDHQYYQWQDGIPTAYETWTASQGRIPFVAWKPKNTNDLSPIRWSVITNGDWDWWITNRANAFRQFGQLTLMTFHHEPENDQDSPGVTNYGTAAEYQAAFRHVVSLFRNQGVTNVIWAVVLTQPSYTDPATGGQVQADRWYPGDDVVDVIGCDGYNWYPAKTNATWISFSNVFSGFYAWGTTNHQKPLLIAEFGCMEDTNNSVREGGLVCRDSKCARTMAGRQGGLLFQSSRSEVSLESGFFVGITRCLSDHGNERVFVSAATGYAQLLFIPWFCHTPDHRRHRFKLPD